MLPDASHPSEVLRQSTSVRSSVVSPESAPSSTDDSGFVFTEKKMNTTSLLPLCKKGKTAMAKDLLLRGGDVNEKGMWGNTPLIVACQYGHQDTALMLLEYTGVDVKHVNENGATALLFACLEGMTEVARHLLSVDCDANISEVPVYNSQTDKSDPMTPLTASVINGHDDIMQLLLSHGAHVDGCVSGLKGAVTGISPLMLACRHGRTVPIQLLLAAGADVKLRDSEGATVLHYLARGPASVAIAQLLSDVATGDVLVAVDTRNDTALHIACDQKQTRIAEWLLESYPCASPACDTPCPLVRSLNSSGFTPLHIAVRRRCLPLVKLLLQHHSDPSQKPHPIGDSAYDAAMKLRKDSEIRTLILEYVQDTALNEEPDKEDAFRTPVKPIRRIDPTYSTNSSITSAPRKAPSAGMNKTIRQASPVSGVNPPCFDLS